MNKRQEKLFGTDGVRGTPGIYPLTDGMVFKIGCGVARLLHYKNKSQSQQLKVIIGRDTRLSGTRIETILVDALTSYGIDALLAGIIPSPGLAFLVKRLNADMGIMISASHNKPTDNGVKFFTSRGYKISVQDEDWIEDIIFNNIIHNFYDVSFQGRGKSYYIEDEVPSYLHFLKSTLQDLTLQGLKVCLDCAWGATSSFAKEVFQYLKAQVYSINDSPCGENINGGGAINPSSLKDLVLKTGADVGFAFDGDGDRVILVDEEGNILDGDYILAILGTYL
jgi:phosphoglucosamine mutase